MLELLNEVLRRVDAGEPLAVCALVRTRGSTPQKAGAVLVVLQDGKTIGTIGGGCVEAEVRTRALRQLNGERATDGHEDAARLLTFRLDQDYGWDDGLVCGGAMDVAVEVIDEPHRTSALREARDQLAAGRVAVLTVEARDAAGAAHAFSREVQPVPALVIAGAGHVGMALATVARLAGFDVTVIDDRADFASAERFPGAQRIVGPIEAELARLHVNDQTYVAIVTRGHRNDARALAAVVASQARYIGLIGSKRKVLAIFDELRNAGTPEALLKRVHAPVGLDIGAVTPAEIAVSIAAELIRVRRDAEGRPAESMRLGAAQLNRLFSEGAGAG